MKRGKSIIEVKKRLKLISDKRGLSKVVNMILLILLGIVAIVTIWVAINAFIVNGSSQISLGRFTLDLKIKAANINYTAGIASVKVSRNPGAGELTGIDFIVEDDKDSYTFHEQVDNFEEYTARTFILNLMESGLNLPKIHKISIAAVFIPEGSNVEKLGNILDSVDGLTTVKNITDAQGDEPVANMICTNDSDCGEDEWIADSEVCSEDKSSVSQYKKFYSCELGFCVSRTDSVVKEDCPSGSECINAQCLETPIPCTEDTIEEACGKSSFVGDKSCSVTNDASIQDYKTSSCIDSICHYETNSIVVENCETNQTCEDGKCFTPDECIDNNDCWDAGVPNGEICYLGDCVPEKVIASGSVRSVWPYGMANYMDSFDLPLLKNETNITDGMYILFLNGSQKTCLTIREFITPDFDGGISYINFAESPTNVNDGDSFEIWETTYDCPT